MGGLDAAREWSEKLDDAQDKCFDEGNLESCQFMKTELKNTQDVFADMAASTKAAAQDAEAKASSVKKAGMSFWALPLSVALSTARPKAICARAPTSVKDFI